MLAKPGREKGLGQVVDPGLPFCGTPGTRVTNLSSQDRATPSKSLFPSRVEASPFNTAYSIRFPRPSAEIALEKRRGTCLEDLTSLQISDWRCVFTLVELQPGKSAGLMSQARHPSALPFRNLIICRFRRIYPSNRGLKLPLA